MSKLRVLFICARNQWRSPTAEQIYRNDPRLDVRSAGVSEKSKRQVRANDLAWADLVLVMEHRHRKRLVERFRDEDLPPIESLEIPDDFEYMDPELIELIKQGTEGHLAQMFPEI